MTNFMTEPVILLIEDMDDNAALMLKVLRARGYDVLWANTGEKGLEMAAEHKLGLILLDLGLPDVDGQTLVRFFRDMPEVADVPIVVVTAWPEESARSMMEAYGCDEIIIKPVSIHLLTNTVKKYFRAK